MVLQAFFPKVIYSALQQGQNRQIQDKYSQHLSTYTMCQYCAKFFIRVCELMSNTHTTTEEADATTISML